MSQERWSEVDYYINEMLLPYDETLNSAIRESAEAGLPAINVAPNQGKLLHLLAKMCGARTVLELGTLGGYSTIWLARALPADGKLVTLEFEQKHAEVARKNLQFAGVLPLVDILVGNAQETLPQLAEKRMKFDFIFIDADKEGYPAYLDWSLKLARRGTVIVADNVVRNGEVVNEKSTDPRVIGIREFTRRLSEDKRVDATSIQTVGLKGYDGFTLGIVTADL